MLCARCARLAATPCEPRRRNSSRELLASVFPSSLHTFYDRSVARTDTLVQTLLSPDLASWVRSRAALDGLQISGWVRQLIHRERLKLVVEGWWFSPQTPMPKTLTDAPYRLERLGSTGDGLEFSLLTAEGEAVTDIALAEYAPMHVELGGGYFVLRGDPRQWSVLYAFADADSGNGLRLVLEPQAISTRAR